MIARRTPARHGRVILVVLVSLWIGCAPARPGVVTPSPPEAAAGRAVPSLPPAPMPVPATPVVPPTDHTPTPTPTVMITSPIAAGALAEAGTIVLRDARGLLYRYEGASGTLARLTSTSAWTVVREVPDGAYEVGSHGAVLFVPWQGETRDAHCGRGGYVSVDPAGSCASAWPGADGGVFVRYAYEDTARRILPGDWAPAGVEWHPDPRRLALLRYTPDATGYQIRGHNALWMLEADGRLRKVYEPCCGSKAIVRMQWAPRGDRLATLLSSGCAGCDGRDGNPLQLVDPESGVVTDLGVTPGDRSAFRWSPAGALAFVRGTSERRPDAVLMLRDPDGSTRELDNGGFAPAWDSEGERLVWARADGSARVIRLGGADHETITCPGLRIEGARFAADGHGLLLLCRKEDPRFDRFELWYASGSSVVPLVRDLGGTSRGLAPDLFDIVAWSGGAGR